MNRQEKEAFIADFRNRLEKAQGTFLVDYKGLNVENINRLRGELKKADAEFRVVKNRLLKLASRGTDTLSMESEMQGTSAIAVGYDDVIAPAKILVNFAKDFDHLKIKRGQISGKVLSVEDVKRLAELPGRDELLAQALSAMQAVPGSLVRVLNGILAKLVYVLKAIEQKKAESA